MYNSLFNLNPQTFWLLATIVLAVIEIITLGLSTIWFAFGAFAAFLLAICGASVPLQIVVFILVSIVSLLLVRPLSMKYLNSKISKTNIDAIVGRKVKVTTAIDNTSEAGTVMMDGTTWNARSVNDDENIEVGETVVIQRVEGNKLFVNKE
ncbi:MULTISPECIES: NfeD family protein [unclassified Butyrivibrio]|uniref:NfeD family protein n=1 Tax=unclassified Butyrivibrio TaxID=2639466 RepID=UPI0003FA600D|nr:MULTISPECIES: NfeD family protein [unclassified Butyrivibrio]